MVALRLCSAFGFLGLLGRAAGDREAQNALSGKGVALHEHMSFKTNSSLNVQFCCLEEDQTQINSFAIDDEASTFGSIVQLGPGANFKSCKITALPSDCLAKNDIGACPDECKTKIKSSKHYWHLVVEKMKNNLDAAKTQQKKNVQDAVSTEERAISVAEKARRESKLTATNKRDIAIKELGKKIEEVGKQIMDMRAVGKQNVKDGDATLKKHTEEIKDLGTKLSEAQDEEHKDSAESLWKTAHAAADEAYETEKGAAAAKRTKVEEEEQEKVDKANTILLEASKKYQSATTPQKVPEGCKAPGGWEGNKDIDNADDCCCSLCSGTTCKGVKTKPSFIDWDSCYSDSNKHQKYSRFDSLYACDAFQGFDSTCEQCKTKACGPKKICPTSRP